MMSLQVEKRDRGQTPERTLLEWANISKNEFVNSLNTIPVICSPMQLKLVLRYPTMNDLVMGFSVLAQLQLLHQQ